jgi:hypothetical protein
VWADGDGDGGTAWDYLDVAHSQQSTGGSPASDSRIAVEPSPLGMERVARHGGSTRPRPWEEK